MTPTPTTEEDFKVVIGSIDPFGQVRRSPGLASKLEADFLGAVERQGRGACWQTGHFVQLIEELASPDGG
jgi:hypothetical protein